MKTIKLPRPAVNSVGYTLVVTLLFIVAPLFASLLAPTAFTHLFAVFAADRGALAIDTFNAASDPAVSALAARGQAQNAPNCLEYVVNGGFEQTSVGWQPTANSSLFTYAEDQFVGGRQSLYLGFTTPVNLPASFGVEQLVNLPAESRAIEFSFFYTLVMEGNATAGDQAYLTVTDVTDNRTLAMLVLSPTAQVTANITDSVTATNPSAVTWSMGRYDLTPLAGKSVRLAFLVENDGAENAGPGNEGEPGKLTMRIDDVSIVACLPLESLALEALPTPTPTLPPSSPAPLTLAPLISPTASPPASPAASPSSNLATTATPLAAVPQADAAVAASPSGLPAAGSITSLEACNCSSTLYACTDFSSWAVAQACYTRCQVTAGYDIHNLDPDKNGIACELELQDVASLEAPPSPQPTPLITTSTSISPSVTSPSAPLEPPVATSEGMTDTAAGWVTDTVAGTVAATSGVTIAQTGTAQTGTVQTSTVQTTTAAMNAAQTGAITPNAPVNQNGGALTPLEMLSLLLFSPLGYVAMGVLVVLGALCLWVAYLLGKRGQSVRQESAKLNPNNVPDDFTLQPNNEVSAPKV